MKFEPTPLKDAWIVTLAPMEDDRGYFSRTFCQKEFEAHGMPSRIAQCNTSFNKKSGTLRGIHFQREPAIETKLVRCVRGAFYDVIVDMRPDSPTYLQHFGLELSQKNMKALFVPQNFAHGFLTLEDDTEAFYLMGEFYTPACEGGLRYNDPALGIQWPGPVNVLSEKDAAWPLIEGTNQVLEPRAAHRPFSGE
jgi:dTDP-4-dehydrorhamnose 3,5-epimerase